MNTTAQYIFDTLHAAGITISDFATMTGISRQTLHHWKSGGAINDTIRLNLSFNTAKRIQQAVDAKKLPLVNKMPAKERVVVLRQIILGG